MSVLPQQQGGGRCCRWGGRCCCSPGGASSSCIWEHRLQTVLGTEAHPCPANTSQSRDTPCSMCWLCFSCTPNHEPARVLHSSHSSPQLQPNNANRQVLASISEAFIIGPSWLVVTRLVVEQLPSNAVRHPLVA